MSSRPWTFWAVWVYWAAMVVFYLVRWLQGDKPPAGWLGLAVVAPLFLLWWLNSLKEADRDIERQEKVLRSEVASEVRRQLEGRNSKPARVIDTEAEEDESEKILHIDG